MHVLIHLWNLDLNDDGDNETLLLRKIMKKGDLLGVSAICEREKEGIMIR
jgi:hypothetical protein